MDLSRITAIVLRQLYLMRNSPSRVLPIFAWCAIDMVLWGFITRYLNTFAAAGLNFIPTLLGAVLLWDFFTRVMFGVTMGFFEDVWSRNFLNLFSTPLRTTEYLIGLVITSAGTSAAALCAMIIIAAAFFGLSILSYGVMVFPFLFILFLFGIALGIVGSSLVLRFGPAAEWMVWPIPALLAPFAGVFYPVATLPPAVRWIAHLMPPSYVFEGLRSIVRGSEFSASSLLLAAATAAFYIGLAFWFFKRTFDRAVFTGLLARYSAETVS